MTASSTSIRKVAALGRLGTESAFEVLARAEALRQQGVDVINLGIGQPDFRTPDHIVEAAKRALDEGAHGYTPAAGIPALRESVARHVTSWSGTEVSAEDVLVVAGGKVTMFFAILMFGEPGAEIMYPNPGFPIYESVIRYSGATAVPIALREEAGFAFDPDEVLAQITPQTRLLIINSPANPTGGVIGRDVIDRLVEGLEQHPHVAVLSDEIYDHILYDGREHVSLLSYPQLRDRLILLNGWSKTYAMTGWRLGYSVWPRSLVADAERLAINCYSCPNAATQHAGLAALEGPQDAVPVMVEAFDERRGIVVELLNAMPGVRCIEPAGAFYAFPNIAETGYSAQALQDRLLEEAGVATIAGTSFGAMGEGYLRISYANSTENIRIALGRMSTILS
jgi:aspartate/methionine/tyrosine aminotransferase